MRMFDEKFYDLEAVAVREWCLEGGRRFGCPKPAVSTVVVMEDAAEAKFWRFRFVPLGRSCSCCYMRAVKHSAVKFAAN